MTTTRKQRDASVASVGRIGPHMERVRAEANSAMFAGPPPAGPRAARLTRTYAGVGNGAENRGTTTWSDSSYLAGVSAGATYDYTATVSGVVVSGLIESATLTWTTAPTITATPTVNVYAYLDQDPEAPSDSNAPSDVTLTTAVSAAITTAAAFTAGVDVTSIVKELIATYGSLTNRINFVVYDGGSANNNNFSWSPAHSVVTLSITK